MNKLPFKQIVLNTLALLSSGICAVKDKNLLKLAALMVSTVTLFGLSGNAYALACTSAATGNWAAAATWAAPCNVATGPVAGDTVTILTSHTVTVASNVAAATLTVNAGGTLSIGNDATARTITLTGALTNSGTVTANAAFAATHTLTIAGDIVNSGTFNLAPNATSLCNVTFNNNGNQTVSGSAMTFNRITLNMGAARANTLDMQAPITTPAGFLTISNGTYKHSSTSNITPWTANPNIPATGGFWLNSAATVTATAFTPLTLNGGLLRVSSGTMNVGSTNTSIVQLANNAATLLLVEGGALNVSGGINSAAITDTGTFTMTGGTVSLMTLSPGAVESLGLGSATTFNMSGGTIRCLIGDNSTYDVNIRSATQNVTGGTLQLGDPFTASTNDFAIATLPAGGVLNIWNLVLASPNRSTLLGSAINVLNDLTINAGNTLDATYAGVIGNITIGGGNSGGTWTNNGAFFHRTNTVSFIGSANTNIAGTSVNTFFNLTINKATNVTITSLATQTVANQLNLTNGTLTTGANVIVTTAACNAPSVVRTSGRVVGNLSMNYPTAAGTTTCTYHIGDATTYAPATIAITGVTSTLANSSLVGRTDVPDHPDTTANLSGISNSKSVNRYWTFTPGPSLTFINYSGTFNFVAGDLDAGTTPANFIIRRKNAGVWSSPTLGAANPLNTSATGITQANGFGIFVIGEQGSLTFTKTVSLICDPVVGGAPATTQHNIPGAIVRWTVTVANTSGISLDLATVTDILSANTTFDNNLVTGAGAAANCSSALGVPESAAGKGFKLDIIGTTRPAASYPKFFTTAADADAGSLGAVTVTINYALGLPIEPGYTAGQLKPNESVVVYFDVTIN